VNSEGLLALIRTGGRLVFVSAVLAVVSAVSALSFVLAVTRVMSIHYLSPRTEQPPCPTLKPPFATCLAHWLTWHIFSALSSRMRLLKPRRYSEKVSRDLEMPYKQPLKEIDAGLRLSNSPGQSSRHVQPPPRLASAYSAQPWR
jgi:hypothetical protein